MPIKTTLWALPPHGRIKHAILRRYLQAWLPIVGRYKPKLVYIDGFAGPGRYAGGEDGSPLIAVKTVREHPAFKTPTPGRAVVFIFIEEKEDRAANLTAELAALGTLPSWIKVQPVLIGTFTEHLDKLLGDLETKGLTLAPTFAFIDPFGIAVPMDLIRRIGQHPACECLISFMYDSVNRFLGKPDLKDHFDSLFATADWRPIVDLDDPAERQQQLVTLYRRQLMSHARFRRVQTFEMIDATNHTEYHLFFATNSDKGLTEMKKAMWKGDPIGGQRFSDRTAGQLTLLHPDPDLLRLRALLQAQFRSKGWVPIEDVEEYVLVSTPYSEEMHLRRKTLGPMEKANPPLIEVRGPSAAVRRAGSYPPGTTLRFV